MNKLKMKNIYKKLAGKKAIKGDLEGKVCGYNTRLSKLILAVTKFPEIESEDEEDEEVSTGWETTGSYDIIVTNSNNKLGYHYINYL